MTRLLLSAFLVAMLSAPTAAAPEHSIGPAPARTAAEEGPAPGALRSELPLPVEIQGRGVLVRAEAGLEDLAREVARSAPDTLEAIRSDLSDLPRPPRVEIRLVKDAAQLAAAAPPGRGAPTWARGVAYPDLGVVTVAHRRGSELYPVESIVAHELAHLALGAATSGRAPRWLDEGFAYLHSSDWSLGRVQTLTGMAWSGDVIPLGELDRHFPARESEVDRAYAQSYDLVAFLARRGSHADRDDDGNRWPFQHFIAQIADGVPPAQAARAAYGATLPQLFDEWIGSLRDRYLTLPAGLVGLAVWVLGAVLLVLGYRRRRRQARETLARWEAEERAADAAALPWLAP